MGLADYCQSIERLDVTRLETQTSRLIAERTTLEARIRRAGARFDSSLREQEDLLASLIVGDVGMLHAPKSLDAPDPVT
jgi:hypothetical protein